MPTLGTLSLSLSITRARTHTHAHLWMAMASWMFNWQQPCQKNCKITLSLSLRTRMKRRWREWESCEREWERELPSLFFQKRNNLRGNCFPPLSTRLNLATGTSDKTNFAKNIKRRVLFGSIGVHQLQMNLLVRYNSLLRSSRLRIKYFRSRSTYLSSGISAAILRCVHIWLNIIEQNLSHRYLWNISPMSHGLVVRAIACYAKEARFNSQPF